MTSALNSSGLRINDNNVTIVGVTSLLRSNPGIRYQSVSDTWSLAKGVRKVESKLLHLSRTSYSFRYPPNDPLSFFDFSSTPRASFSLKATNFLLTAESATPNI